MLICYPDHGEPLEKKVENEMDTGVHRALMTCQE